MVDPVESVLQSLSLALQAQGKALKAKDWSAFESARKEVDKALGDLLEVSASLPADAAKELEKIRDGLQKDANALRLDITVRGDQVNSARKGHPPSSQIYDRKG